MIKVKNVHGTGGRKPKDASTWIEYWEKHKGKREYTCSACRCLSLRLCGAHVKKCLSSREQSWYIVPLCPACNQRTDEFFVEAGLLVPVCLETH